MLDIDRAICSNYFSHLTSSSKKETFYKYQGIKLVSSKAMFLTETGTLSISYCTIACKELENCKAVNYNKINNQIGNCQYFSTSDATVITDVNTILLTTNKQCSGYCDEFDYVDLCSQCRCKDICSSLTPNVCDCTKTFEKIQNCSVLDERDAVAGLYTFENNGIRSQDVCQEGIDGKLWLTVLSAFYPFHTYLTQSEKREGFGMPYEDVYWSGWKRIKRFINNNTNVDLRVELMTFEGDDFYIDYKDFKLYGNDEKKLFQRSYKSSTSFTCVQNLLSPSNLGSGCVFADFSGTCNSSNKNLLATGWQYTRMKVLLRPKTKSSEYSKTYSMKKS